MIRRILTTVVAAALVGAAVQVFGTTAEAAGVPAYDHVFVIVMENKSYGEIIGNASAPYINSLRSSGSLATNYFGAGHPSLPNYLALTGGSTFGISSDCTTCWISATNLGDRLEAAGSSWKAYEESMPSPCFVGDSYPYAQKHDPFIYYNDIRTNPSRCQSHVVPYTQLATDLASASTTPNFAFITPNLCSDMHDCAVATGDSWLQQQVPAILASPAFTTQHSLLALTWDEDDLSASNQVATVFLGYGVNPGGSAATSYNHYSLLRTIEAARGLSTLTGNDAAAASMQDMFTSRTTSPNACVSTALSAAPAAPQHAGTAVTFTATSAGCPSPTYELWVMPPGGAWQLEAPYSASPTFTWSTSGLGLGTYRFSVWARDASSAGVYANGMGAYDAFSASTYYTLSGGCVAVSAAPSPGAATPSTAVTLDATATGCGSTPEYEFWILPPGGAAWQVAQPYSTSATFSWSTSGLAPGAYRFSIWVRSGASGAFANSLGTYDAFDASLVETVGGGGCAAVGVAATPGSPATSGTQVTLTTAVTGCSGPSPASEFWILAPGRSGWQVAQPYSSAATFTWSTGGLAAGTYRFSVWVRSGASGVYSNSLGSYDAFNASLSFTLS